MSDGYVMGVETFSDAKFSTFFRDTININIDDVRYGCQSKAKRLRSFWQQEPDPLVGKVLGEMLKLWVHKQQDKAAAIKDHTYVETQKAVVRLVGKTAETTASPEDDLLSRNFGKIKLSSLGLESALEPILESRIKEIRVCLEKDASLAAIFLAGSVLEGLLLSFAIKNPQKFNQSSASPKDKKTGDVLKFQEWALSSFIDVAHEVGLLGLDIKKHGHSLRDFRNFIHPYAQMHARFAPDINTARISMQVLLAAIADLSGQRKGAS